jgi:hypothetical protein
MDEAVAEREVGGARVRAPAAELVTLASQAPFCKWCTTIPSSAGQPNELS